MGCSLLHGGVLDVIGHNEFPLLVLIEKIDCLHVTWLFSLYTLMDTRSSNDIQY